MARRTITLMHQKGQAKLQWRTLQSASSKKRLIGVCDPMNLSVEADSLDELYSTIPEAINVLLLDLLIDNKLQPFLKEIGWQFPAGKLPVPKPNEDFRFDVPWELVVPGAMGGSKRRAFP